MSNNSPTISATISSLLPSFDSPTLTQGCISYTSAIGSEFDGTLPTIVSLYVGNGGFSVADGDLAFVSGSVWIAKDDDTLIAYIDSSNVNTVVHKPLSGTLTPTSESLSTFQLTGSVISIHECTFTLETGCYWYEVCSLTLIPRIILFSTLD